MGDKIRVGRHDGRIQKMLNEKVVLPTITTNMTTKDIIEQQMIYQDSMRKYKRVKCFFEIGIDSKTLEKMKKSTWKGNE